MINKIEDKFLPVGTVVRLKEATGCLMISGFCVTKDGDSTKIYDYLGCMYPQGMIAQDTNFLFDHSQIDEVLFKGFVDHQEIDFKVKLNDYLATNNIVSGAAAPNNTVHQSIPAQGNVQPQMFGGNINQ